MLTSFTVAIAALAASTAQPVAQRAPATADPSLVEEIRLAVEMIRPQLPLKQGPITVTDITADGAELIFDLALPEDFDNASFADFRRELPVRACAEPQAVQLFRRGGTYTYRLTGKDGEVFTASVSSC